MARIQIVDAYPGFESIRDVMSERSLADQIKTWQMEYMSSWPELFSMQVECYAEDDMDWHQAAEEHIFPYLKEYLPAMQRAHKLLLDISPEVYEQARKVMKIDMDLVVVIYVGVGCGAGWATKYGGKPAILFGLENIAAEGWAERRILSGLTAHELGHLIHFHWMEEAGLEQGNGGWWSLFEEGFAQRSEHLILGEELFHMSLGAGVDGWIEWCRANQAWLAAEYLRCMDSGEAVNKFYGSWFNIKGYKETGYFLGHEVIRSLEANYSIKEIALLTDYERIVRSALERFAHGNS